MSSDEEDSSRTPPALEFRLLGPVQATLDGTVVDLGGTKPSGLLAVLLLAANTPVSTSELIDALWWDAPRSAPKMIQMHVSRIRQQLGVMSGRLRTVQRGYLIEVAADELDLSRVSDLAARGRAVAAQDPQLASRLLAEALALFRGPALATVRDEPFASGSVMRLDELRIGLLEDRIDADLAVGRGRALIGELHGLVAAHPSREHLGEQLMLALYQADRQTEALEAARSLRARLAHDLGISPSPAIDRLEVAILNHDPSLAVATSPVPTPSSAPSARSSAPTADDTGTRQPDLGDTPPRPPGRSWSRRTVLAAAAVVAAGMVVVLMTTLNNPAKSGGPSADVGAIQPASLVVVDGDTDTIRADIPLGGEPAEVSVASDAAFVGNKTLRTLTQVDLDNDTAGQAYGLPMQPAELAATSNDVWVSDGFSGEVSRFSRSGKVVIAPFYPAERSPGRVALAADDRSLWAGLPDGNLVEVRTSSLGPPEVSTRLRDDRVELLADDGNVVCAGYFRVAAIDCLRPEDGTVVASMKLSAPAHAVVVGQSGAWALAGAPATLWHLQVSTGAGGPAQRIPPGATALALSTSYLWLLYGDQGRLRRLPLRGNEPAVSVGLGRPAVALATWGDQVLVTMQ